jgi:hypothetical protein
MLDVREVPTGDRPSLAKTASAHGHDSRNAIDDFL